MRRQITVLTLIATLAMLVVPAYAQGTIRIEPSGDPNGFQYPNPVVLSSPATFNISDVSKTTYQPHILLVMTVASYNGLTGNVTVNWTGDVIEFMKANFVLGSFGGGDKIPPVVEAYTVAACADHLGVEGHDVYYAYGPFLANPISSTKQAFTITATSTALKMLVYAVGSVGSANDKYDNKVPPTQPGLVVPEPAIVLLMLAPFAALGTYAIKRRKP